MANPATHMIDESVKGAFRRLPTAFHNKIAKNAKFVPEKGRYHLYVSYACPWCHRCLALIALKGLENVISVSNVDPYLAKFSLKGLEKGAKNNEEFLGWQFNSPNYSDPLHENFISVWDLYRKAQPDYPNKKLTVPILWDKKNETIVNNESSEIIVMFNEAFNDFATYPDLDLNPNDTEIQAKMKQMDDLIYPNINDGVYRCGFAKSQEAYDYSFQSLFNALDKVEKILSKNRYLTGDTLTLSDIRLWVTLMRFDNVYYVHFKCNGRLLHKDYPNIWGFTKELYQMNGMKKFVDIPQYKYHYYYSHQHINTFQIIPKGPFNVNFDEPHLRNSIKFNKKKKILTFIGLTTGVAIVIGVALKYIKFDGKK